MNPGASLLLVTHGIRGGPGTAADLARVLAATGQFRAVRVGCHKARPDLDEALGLLPPGPVVAAPLLMAKGWIFDAIRRRLASHPRTDEVSLAPPAGAHPDLWRLVETRALALCDRRSWQPRGTTLLLAGHGTPRHAGAAATTRAVAATIAARGTFAEVRTGFLDEAPELADVAAGLGPDRPCVAVGFFVDNGPHGRDDVAEALAAAPIPIAYTGAIAADEAVLPYLLDQIRAARPILATAQGAPGSARSRPSHIAAASV
jgi:sirohydrochlorin ferrochelatase